MPFIGALPCHSKSTTIDSSGGGSRGCQPQSLGGCTVFPASWVANWADLKWWFGVGPLWGFFWLQVSLKKWWWIIEQPFFIPQIEDSISDIRLIEVRRHLVSDGDLVFFWWVQSWIWQHKCHVAALKLMWVSKTYHWYKASLASSYILLTKFWNPEIFIDFPISQMSCWWKDTTIMHVFLLHRHMARNYDHLADFTIVLHPDVFEHDPWTFKWEICLHQNQFCRTVWRLDWWWTIYIDAFGRECFCWKSWLFCPHTCLPIYIRYSTCFFVVLVHHAAH